MAKLKGTFMTSLVIDASKEDLFIALAQELKIDSLFKEERDGYYKLELDTSGTCTPYIVYMENKCYHGTPLYEEIARRAISMESYRCAVAMQELRDAMKSLKRSQTNT